MRIVVLGGGIVGVTTAYALARDGHEVVVVDRQPLAANETSFSNAGMVAPGHAYTWASPRAPKILLTSLWRDDTALRFKFSTDLPARMQRRLGGAQHRQQAAPVPVLPGAAARHGGAHGHRL